MHTPPASDGNGINCPFSLRDANSVKTMLIFLHFFGVVLSQPVTSKYTQEIHSTEAENHLTSSSLYQDRDSAVRTNQYSLEPPFMMLMLMVSQPFLITYKMRKYGTGEGCRDRGTPKGWGGGAVRLILFNVSSFSIAILKLGFN